MNEFAKESGHWYTSEGEPAYTQPNKSKPGEFRNTTVRDAKKLGLKPSVTTILGLADKPGLNRWKLNQVMLAALTLPHIEGEPLRDFESRIWEDSNAQAKEARERGTVIHGAIEGYFKTGQVTVEFEREIESVNAQLEIFGEQEWLSEKSAVSGFGYGGKIDLHSANVIVDYKSKEFGKDEVVKAYDEQCMQLAAYRQMINPEAQCANLYISRNNPGITYLHIWSEDDLIRGWGMFKCMLDFWYLTKRMDKDE